MRKSRRIRAIAGWLWAIFASACPLLAGDGVWTSEGSPAGAHSLGLGAPPRTLFASTWSGLVRSTQDGVWEPIPGTSTNGAPVAVDPSHPEILYAVGEDFTLLKSTDSADHFQVLSGVSLASVSAIAVDPAQTSTVYVGGSVGQDAVVFKTKDGGTSWSPLKTESLVEAIASLVVDPHDHDNIYAGADVFFDYCCYGPHEPHSDNDALIGSRDGGETWLPLLGQSEGQQLNILDVHALAVDPQTGSVFAGAQESTGGAVFHSDDLGATWTQAPIGMGLAVFGVNALVIDPTTPTTIYAGTTVAGVFRSLDGGATWAPMNDGLSDDAAPGYSGLWINSLALDPADGVLRAGTENGVFAIRPNSPSSPCDPAPDRLCLLDGRFRVTVMAQNTRTFAVGRGAVALQSDRFGVFSLPSFTGDASFPEVVVKMIAPSGGGAWVYHGSLTSLPYILTVTDTTTGQIETYTNDPQNRFCGGADTSAFSDSGAGLWDFSANAASHSQSENEALSLIGGRFSVTLAAVDHNRTVPGAAVAETDRYGYFSLPGVTGDPTFPEVFVKMVDFSAVDGSFWLFYTGLTHLAYTLTVTDSETGAVRTYTNTTPLCGAADVHASTE